MPQFDPAVWPPQLVWLVISFVALYYLMARVALPKVAEVLEEREFRINESLRKAEALKQQAEDAVAAYEKLMADARAKASDQLNGVRERAAAEAAERHAELGERLSKQVAEAEGRIAAARGEALAHIREVAVTVTGAAIERLVGQPANAASVDSAVDAAMGGKA
jgi:F0F1-type ATP synthase, subunit b